ncbi:hypothetical protein [Streptomyces noursei]|uniref:hypothetical protein n=1 Tax=Streptomyces noursei TaxID=1971 RepID=UPI0016798D3A|nr:hypothetical protein [Streptomyces noursei]MCZ1014032.1 hypothetical protein [Streptomyces noursei]GGX49318.1 hypothetical protein GCM10010341_83720 [Streptomyces noursei]
MSDNLPAQFQPQVLAAHMDYAKALAQSDLLPRQYQGKPANLLWAISYGQTLGVDPMTAVQSIHVINGRPTASADLIAGLVRRAGHKLRITSDDRKAVAQIVRADDPAFTFEAVWTIERAQAAKLTGKDTWKQFPAAMLKARAITEVARAACSEILQGTIYTPEELGAVVDQDGEPIDAPVQPLRVVQHDVVRDPHTAAQGRDYLHEAHQAESADAVRAIYREAAAAGAIPDYLAQIVEVGRQKAAAEQDSAAVDGDTVEAEIIPDQPADEHAAAEAELRQFAAQVGLDDIDRDAEGALGMPLNLAPAEAIRSLLAQLRGTAA